MIEIINKFIPTQVVNESTRQNNILDLILTTNPDIVQTPKVFPGMSDHSVVTCKVEARIKPRRNVPRTVLLFKKGDMNTVKKDLRTNFHSFESNAPQHDANDNWECFKTIITNSINANIPKKKISGKHHLPWITTEIKQLIRRKQRRYNSAKKYNRLQDWQSYRDTRTLIHKKLREGHNKYINGLLEETDQCNEKDRQSTRITKRFWTYIRSKRKDAPGISVLRRPDDTEATDAFEKANILNEQYQSAFTKETTNLPIIDQNDIPPIPKINITVRGIIKQLRSLNPTKSTGPDKIPTRVLKETANETAPYLCLIFQQSIDTGCVPNDWKNANITAIHKKGKRDTPSNYRPISLTSVSCKILEHIIYHTVMCHLELHDILVDYQHGFRKNRSCETQLINTIESITKSFDNGKQVDLLVLDFSKAFDTVPHNRLLLKLEQIGIRDISHADSCEQEECNGECEQQLLTWFRNWLCDRTQQVVLEGQSSDVCQVISGVPQGTVLGPLCFLVFINDIGKDISTHNHITI